MHPSALRRENLATVCKLSLYLEDILLAVNDGEASTVVNESNVTSGEPTLRVDGILGVLLVLVVALEDSVATDPDLAAGVGLVSDTVVHLGDIHQLELAASARAANVARDVLTNKSIIEPRREG